MSDAAQDRPSGVPHRDFLEAALSAAGEWTRYADPKVLGVLVLLGLGINDLVGHAGRFVHPHEPVTARCVLLDASGHTCEGIAATTLFFVACVLAALVVVFVTSALFSRLRMKTVLGRKDVDAGAPRSLFFFSEIRRFTSQEEYAAAVLATSEHDLLRDVAGQVYELSAVAHKKHVATQRAYLAALAFLVAWVAGRVLLSMVS